MFRKLLSYIPTPTKPPGEKHCLVEMHISVYRNWALRNNQSCPREPFVLWTIGFQHTSRVLLFSDIKASLEILNLFFQCNSVAPFWHTQFWVFTIQLKAFGNLQEGTASMELPACSIELTVYWAACLGSLDAKACSLSFQWPVQACFIICERDECCFRGLLSPSGFLWLSEKAINVKF